MFDPDALRHTIARHGPTARIVVASVEGSSPREAGASMLVWKDGHSGTIGGGALEWQAIATARTWPRTRLDRVPLGPALGQCCGGAVTLLTETYGATGCNAAPSPLGGPEHCHGDRDQGEATPAKGSGATTTVRTPLPARSEPGQQGADPTAAPPPPTGGRAGEGGAVPEERRDTLATLTSDIFARPVGARPVDRRPMPLSVKRLLDRARAQGHLPAPTLLQGWFIEPLARPTRHLWIWGAGHVGRALVNTMAPLPDLAITWIDVAPDRFPDTIPPNVTMLPASDPAALVPHAPQDADHLILTYSHALDLDLCHRLLSHGFRTAGLIGSATKWARFRSRLTALGHPPRTIRRIRCPIGDPSLGKHPQAIAIGVASAYLSPATATARQEIAG